jgi:hypothetical protein
MYSLGYPYTVQVDDDLYVTEPMQVGSLAVCGVPTTVLTTVATQRLNTRMTAAT